MNHWSAAFVLTAICLCLLGPSCRQAERNTSSPAAAGQAEAPARQPAKPATGSPAGRSPAPDPGVVVEGTAKHGDKPAEPAEVVVLGVISGKVIRLTQNWPNPFDGKPPVEPFPGVRVMVLQEGVDKPVATATSDSEGRYSISGLPDGVFTVRVDDSAFKGKVIQPAPGYAYVVLPEGAAGVTFLDSNGFSAGKLAAGQAP